MTPPGGSRVPLVGWRWQNVPLPESHLALLGAGLLLHAVRPARITGGSFLARRAGWSLVIGGSMLAAWATWSAADTDLARPGRLVTTGAYRLSRHPMYLGWSFIYLGLGLALRSAWLLAMAPLLSLLVHREVLNEERRLEEVFGSSYSAYRRRVRRYL